LKYEEDRVSIPIGDKDRTSGIISLPAKIDRRMGVVIAHGAGNDMNTPLVAFFADGLARAGYPVLRFNFLYKEDGRRAPDNGQTLAKTWAEALSYAKGRLEAKVDVWVAAGKSMGGRIAALMVADGLLPVHRLIFLGYPLHPAGEREKVRAADLDRIKIPMLFFAGTRDPLCDMAGLKEVLQRVTAPQSFLLSKEGTTPFMFRRRLTKRKKKSSLASSRRASRGWQCPHDAPYS